MNQSVKFISACCKHGQPKSGVELAGKFVQNFFQEYDFKTIEGLDCHFNYIELYETHKNLFENNKVITIGGDHSISLATVASSAKKFKEDLTVIWVDAHADINTRESSLSGNLHGMPVSSLIGLDNIYNLEIIKPEQIIYIGLRDLDDFEIKTIESLNIKNYTSEYVRNNSMEMVLNEIKPMISSKVHISFDVDVLDPTIFPCTGTPVDNGINLNDAKTLLASFKENWVSADFVEFNPNLGENPQQNALILRDLVNCIA